MPFHFHAQYLIRHKRDGLPVSDEEIAAFVAAVVNHSITDAQIAAFLMAVFFRGLSPEELASLTKHMRFSGEVFDAKPLKTFTVDKHSTGGVGDKTSLLIAPILAAAGLGLPTSEGLPGICVPMISGRSLGHTGGTLDKLETIPGFDTQLSMARFEQVLRQCGAAMIGQTPRLVPADRILYALRDHTGTVESPYLITASIMSKKLAESLNALVLDVKVGSGAFMPTYELSRQLAELMVATGEREGTTTVALLTSMEEPLGRFSGNWCEVRECIDIMKQDRHPMSADLIRLSTVLAGWMLYLADHAETPVTGAALADEILTCGAAFESFLEIVHAQGGDISVIEGDSNPADFHIPGATRQLVATTSGYLSSMDCKEVGWAVQRLGAGRARPGDPVSAAAGIEVHAKLGDRVTAGQPLVTLFADTEAQLEEPYAMLAATYRIAAERPVLQPLVREVIAR
jgi:pyrimidine-nucleoside phosphorylase